MSYNRVRTPKFYIDAMLLARQWGAITRTAGDNGKYYLNPSNVTGLTTSDTSGLKHVHIDFENRYWCNSISHLFVLGHNLFADNIGVSAKIEFVEEDESGSEATPLFSTTIPVTNGWNKFTFENITENNNRRFVASFSGDISQSFKLGDISAGWSYAMPHSPDLELTQGISNESIKTQTTKGGHTLTNAGYNQQPNWIRQPWTTGTTNTVAEGRTVFPVGRRSWNLKFSYISDTDLFPSSYNSATGIFQWSGTDPDTGIAGTNFFIKDNFVDKVYHGTNGFQLPFIFQPDSNTEEYAICRINNDSISFNQTSHNVYDISLDIIEVW